MTGGKMDTLFFYGHRDGLQWSFLSNFYQQSYSAPDPSQWLNDESETLHTYEDRAQLLTFSCSEQYMMYCKAILFADHENAQQILAARSPAACKALGRKVKMFDDATWVKHRERIMEEALWWKFGGGSRVQWQDELPELGLNLLKTGERELVEAAPRDRIWGIGFAAKNAEQNRAQWGSNLLGLALMKVRSRLRALDDAKES